MINKVMIISIFLCTMVGITSGLALTPKQIIELKKAGVSDKTIQMMLRQEEGKDPYATIGTREVKDKDGNAMTIYTTGANPTGPTDEEKENLERAWQMLNNIRIIKK